MFEYLPGKGPLIGVVIGGALGSLFFEIPIPDDPHVFKRGVGVDVWEGVGEGFAGPDVGG